MAERPSAGTIILLIVAAPILYLLVEQLASLIDAWRIALPLFRGPLAEAGALLATLINHVYNFLTNPVFLAILIGVSIVYAVLSRE